MTYVSRSAMVIGFEVCVAVLLHIMASSINEFCNILVCCVIHNHHIHSPSKACQPKGILVQAALSDVPSFLPQQLAAEVVEADGGLGGAFGPYLQAGLLLGWIGKNLQGLRRLWYRAFAENHALAVEEQGVRSFE